MKKVFLCHASEDKAIAELIQLALASAGHEVFYDENSLPAGGDYHDRIHKAISQSDLFIFLISKASIQPGKYTLSELAFAQEQWSSPVNKVLPVNIAAVPTENIPPYLAATTVLSVKGNPAAEVRVAANNLLDQGIKRGGHRNLKYFSWFLGILLSGSLTVCIYYSRQCDEINKELELNLKNYSNTGKKVERIKDKIRKVGDDSSLLEQGVDKYRRQLLVLKEYVFLLKKENILNKFYGIFSRISDELDGKKYLNRYSEIDAEKVQELFDKKAIHEDPDYPDFMRFLNKENLTHNQYFLSQMVGRNIHAFIAEIEIAKGKVGDKLWKKLQTLLREYYTYERLLELRRSSSVDEPTKNQLETKINYLTKSIDHDQRRITKLRVTLRSEKSDLSKLEKTLNNERRKTEKLQLQANECACDL